MILSKCIKATKTASGKLTRRFFKRPGLYNSIRNNMRIFCILLVFLVGCAQKGGKQRASTVDTTRVITLALKTVMSDRFPVMDGIKRKSTYNDSIFLTTKLFSLSNLPANVDSFHFKVIPDSMICSAIRSDTTTAELPNYLRLKTFEKNDTGYLVQFESVDCIPYPSLDGAVSLQIRKTKDKYQLNRK